MGRVGPRRAIQIERDFLLEFGKGREYLGCVEDIAAWVPRHETAQDMRVTSNIHTYCAKYAVAVHAEHVVVIPRTVGSILVDSRRKYLYQEHLWFAVHNRIRGWRTDLNHATLHVYNNAFAVVVTHKGKVRVARRIFTETSTDNTVRSSEEHCLSVTRYNDNGVLFTEIDGLEGPCGIW